MELTLNHGEQELLVRVLRQYLSDLRMEIADTEQFDFRQGLKADEDLIKGLLARLEQGETRAA